MMMLRMGELSINQRKRGVGLTMFVTGAVGFGIGLRVHLALSAGG